MNNLIYQMFKNIGDTINLNEGIKKTSDALARACSYWEKI